MCVCVYVCLRMHPCMGMHTAATPSPNHIKKTERGRKNPDTCLFVKCGTAGLERMKAVGEKRRSDRFLRGEKLDEGPEMLPIRRE